MIHTIISQTGPAIDSGFFQLAQLGLGVLAFALVVWIVRYVTTKTIPEMLAKHEAIATIQLQVFERVNKDTRVEFREILEKDREMHYAREKSLREEFRVALKEFKAAQEQVVDKLPNSD